MQPMAHVKALASLLTEGGYCSEKAVMQWLQTQSIPSVSANIGNIFSHVHEELASVKRVLTALVSCGVAEYSLLKLISSSSAAKIFSTNPAKIAELLNGLAKLGFNESERARLVTSCPDIIQRSGKEVSESYLWMRQTFTDRQAHQLVFLRPEVLAADKETLIDRANYLFARMRVIGREVAHSGALGHSIDRIRCRHMFLLRAGRYEFPDAKAKIHRLGKNPSLREILDTSDKDFATKIAHLTVPEYVLFQKLLVEEDKHDSEQDY